MKKNGIARLCRHDIHCRGGRGQAQGTGAGKPLDRDGLIKLANDYYCGAARARSGAQKPLASDVFIVENAKRIQTGEGLWKSTSAAPTEFKFIGRRIRRRSRSAAWR